MSGHESVNSTEVGQLAYDDYAQAKKVSGQPGSNCKDEKSAEQRRCCGRKGWATQSSTNVIFVERC